MDVVRATFVRGTWDEHWDMMNIEACFFLYLIDMNESYDVQMLIFSFLFMLLPLVAPPVR